MPTHDWTEVAAGVFHDFHHAWIEQGVHLLIVDLFPSGPRDPDTVHGAIRECLTAAIYDAPAGQPITLAAYESGPATRAYVEHLRVGEPLVEMPLFLRPGAHVSVPLERTYMEAFAAVPARWRAEIEPGAGPG